MRRLHRWFGIISSLFFLFVAITGLALQIELWVSGKAPPGQKPSNPKQIVSLGERPNNLQAAQLVQQAVKVLNDNDLTNMPDTISFSKTDTGWILSLRQGGQNNQVVINQNSAQLAPVVEKSASVPWHLVFQNWHAGYAYGLMGRILSCLIALALIFLSGSGLYLYLTQYRRRKRQGNRKLFW